MSQTRTEAESTFDQIIDGLQNIDPKQARELLAELTFNIDDRKFVKGRDIAKVIIGSLVSMGASPERPPIFRAEGTPIKGFLHEFKTPSIDKLQDSLPVHLSGCSVELVDLTYEELNPTEKSIFDSQPTDEMFVRINFVPQEI